MIKARKPIKTNIIYGLDFGTVSLKITAVELQDSFDFDILERIEYAYPKPLNIKSLEEFDIKSFLNRCFNRFDKEIGVENKYRKALVSLPMSLYRAETITSKIDVSDGAIKYEDKISLLQKAKDVSASGVILHTIPIKYLVDDEEVLDPIGLQGKTFGMNVFIIGYDEFHYDLFKNAFNQLLVNVGKFIAPPLSFVNLFLNVTNASDKEKSWIVFDMGGNASFCFGLAEKLKPFFFNIPLGSEIIKKDIAKVLKVEENLAELLLHKEVDVNLSQTDQKEYIGGVEVDRDLLNQVVAARYSELINMISQDSSFESFKEKAEGIILVGSGHVQGADILVNDAWHLPVKQIENLGDVDQFIYSIGNIHYSINNEIFLPQIHNPKSNSLFQRFIRIFEDIF